MTGVPQIELTEVKLVAEGLNLFSDVIFMAESGPHRRSARAGRDRRRGRWPMAVTHRDLAQSLTK